MIEGIAPHRDTLYGPKPFPDYGTDGVAAEFAVGSLIADFRGNADRSLENDFRGRRHFDIYGFASNQLYRSFSERSCDRELIDVDRGNELRSEKDRRIGAND